jgi:hypothetical protein
MNSSDQKKKNKKPLKHPNTLETLKDVGGSTLKSFKKDVFQSGSREFVNQLFGRRGEANYSGELSPGQSLEMEDVYTGKEAERAKLEKQLALERRLREEEKIRTEKKTNELKLQLHALMKEVASFAKSAQNLDEEVKIASMQAPVNPGVYHIVYFEKLLTFLKGYNKKISQATVWLRESNKRAAKKNYWTRYKKHGGKFLLAADHYLTRSAG